MASGFYAPMRPLLAHEMAIQQQAAAQRNTTGMSQVLEMLQDVSARQRDVSAHMQDMSARLGQMEARE